MATTLSNLSIAGIEMAIQQALKTALIPLNAFSLGINTAGMRLNDIKRVPVLGDPSAQVKTPGTAVTEDGTVTGVDVTLDTAREAAFSLIEGQVTASEAQAYAEGLASGAVYSIAKAVMDSAFALFTAANFSTKHVCPVSNFSSEDLGSLFQAAEKLKLGRNRSLILNAAYTSQLIGSSTLGLILATLGDAALKTAALPPLMGMSSYVYSGLPDNSENLGGIVTDKTAIAVALAPPEQLVNAGEANCIFNNRVSEPDSGVTVNYKMVGDADGGKIKGIVTLFYGVDVVRDAAVRLVTSV